MSDARVREIHWLQTGATHYHAQIGLPDKGRNILNLGEKNIMIKKRKRVFFHSTVMQSAI